MGKYYKWTEKDTALFKRALTKTGQVIIQVQDEDEVEYDRRKVKIIERLTEEGYYFQHEFDIMRVPNIIHLTYLPNKDYLVEKVAI